MNRRNFLKGFLATATVVALAPLGPVVEIPVGNVINFDALVATTLKNYRDVLVANITSHQVIWFRLKEMGFIQEGKDIVEPLIYA